jgi:hypothetical protein
MKIKESRLASKAEREVFARKLSRTGEQFVKNSDKFAKELRARNDRFMKGLK